MKKNKTKKILWITAVFFTFIALILIINESYALLQTISSGSAEVKTGSWTIKINEKNISNGITETFTLNNVIYDESNENIENKKYPKLFFRYSSCYLSIFICRESTKCSCKSLFASIDNKKGCHIEKNLQETDKIFYIVANVCQLHRLHGY